MFTYFMVYVKKFTNFRFKVFLGMKLFTFKMNIKIFNLQYHTLSSYVRSQMHAPTPNCNNSVNLCYETAHNLIMQKLVFSSFN